MVHSSLGTGEKPKHWKHELAEPSEVQGEKVG